MSRAFLLILDSVGIGASADAAHFGDAGPTPSPHRGALRGGRRRPCGLRQGPLALPNLVALRPRPCRRRLAGHPGAGLSSDVAPSGAWGYGIEVSSGKDTPSGHWEIAGVPVPFEWGYFPQTVRPFRPTSSPPLIAEGRAARHPR